MDKKDISNKINIIREYYIRENNILEILFKDVLLAMVACNDTASVKKAERKTPSALPPKKKSSAPQRSPPQDPPQKQRRIKLRPEPSSWVFSFTVHR